MNGKTLAMGEPDAVVAAVRARFEREWPARLVEEISRHDRYQSSRGINAAGDVVAAAAEEAGLADVQVHTWHSNGSRRWWTFAGPPPWTPESAMLRVTAAGECKLDIRYPRHPCSLAAYSCSTPLALSGPLVRASELGSSRPPRGGIVLLDDELPVERWLSEMEAAGVRGVVCGPGGCSGQPRGLRRRVELPFGSTMFAFSLSAGEMRRLTGAGGALMAEAHVATAAAGYMPVVTGVLPGQGGGEILLLSHLCHPRPGANDNASGVVANLAIAKCLAGARVERSTSIRFLWAPEFAGTAAYLHDLVLTGPLETPLEAVNLDIVGQRTQLCVEHPPAHVGALFPAAIERCLVALDQGSPAGGRWGAAPFAGLSDHQLLVDPAIGVPATLLGQAPDEVNHSSEDVPARVDLWSLERATVAVAAAAELLSKRPGPRGLRQWLLDSMRRRIGVDSVNGPHYAIECFRRNLEEAACRYRRAGAPGPTSAGERGHRGFAPPPARSLERCWPGPFNLRALFEDLPDGSRRRLQRALSRDRRTSFTQAVSLAMEIDGCRPAASVIRRAGALSGQPPDPGSGQDFFDALCEAGWARWRA